MQHFKPYVVRERSVGAMRHTLPVFGVAWGLFALWVAHAGAFTAVVGTVGAVALWGKLLVFPAPVLELGSTGFRLDDAIVPWPSLWQVLITFPDVETRPAPAVEIGLRLYRGAPLPNGMKSVVYDPRDPYAPQCRRSFRAGKVDIGRLTATIRTLSRAEIVESRGGRERRVA